MGHADIIKELLTHGAKIDAPREVRDTAGRLSG